jgi:hypothetical protein
MANKAGDQDLAHAVEKMGEEGGDDKGKQKEINKSNQNKKK